MGAPLQTVALVARTLALMYNKPLIGVNHCVGRGCEVYSVHVDMPDLVRPARRYRDRPPDHRVSFAHRALRLWRQHTSYRLLATTVSHLWRDARHRRGQLSGSVRRLRAAFFRATSSRMRMHSFARIIGLSNDPSPGANIEKEAKK